MNDRAAKRSAKLISAERRNRALIEKVSRIEKILAQAQKSRDALEGDARELALLFSEVIATALARGH